MSLVLNTNVAALIAEASLGTNSQQVKTSMERLSSGYRINHASDDAAGLMISENLSSQVMKMNQNLRNTQDGISVLQTAESGLSAIGDSLQRVRELAVQAANDTNSPAARSAIAVEMMSLLKEIDRIALSANFNGVNLLDGSATNASIQVGPNSTAATNTVNVTNALTAAGTGDAGGPGGLAIVGAGATFANINAIGTTGLNATNAQSFLNDVDQALTKVNNQRAKIGSYQNQLDNITTNLQASVENFSASNSRIRDVDIAAESSVLTQYQVLQQASVSILAQANNIPQMILKILAA